VNLIETLMPCTMQTIHGERSQGAGCWVSHAEPLTNP